MACRLMHKTKCEGMAAARVEREKEVKGMFEVREKSSDELKYRELLQAII